MPRPKRQTAQSAEPETNYDYPRGARIWMRDLEPKIALHRLALNNARHPMERRATASMLELLETMYAKARRMAGET